MGCSNSNQENEELRRLNERLRLERERELAEKARLEKEAADSLRAKLEMEEALEKLAWEKSHPKLNEELISETIELQNEKRLQHGCSELVEDIDLSYKAQAYANQLAENDEISHSDQKLGSKSIGENCGMFCDSDIESTTPSQYMTDLWYEEIKDYDFNQTDFGYRYNTKNFTQMVWKETKQVGIGMAQGKSGNWYFVANYYPKGNEEGEFKKNVIKVK